MPPSVKFERLPPDKCSSPGVPVSRLSFVLTLMTGSGLARGLVTIVLSLGFYVWLPVAFAPAAGLFLLCLVVHGISRRIKRGEPAPMPRTGTHRHTRHPKVPDT